MLYYGVRINRKSNAALWILCVTHLLYLVPPWWCRTRWFSCVRYDTAAGPVHPDSSPSLRPPSPSPRSRSWGGMGSLGVANTCTMDYMHISIQERSITENNNLRLFLFLSVRICWSQKTSLVYPYVVCKAISELKYTYNTRSFNS